MDDPRVFKKVTRGSFGKRRLVVKPAGRWQSAVSREAVDFTDTELEGSSKEERGLKEGDRGGHGPKMGRSATQEAECNLKTCT
jgi:hypothetical protein